jgi:hypothetical protein
METPSISVRRHPLFAIAVLIVGFGWMGVGLYLSNYWILALGVLHVIFAALLMLNPFVTITDQSLDLKNVFGLVRASYDHDGFHLIRLQNDVVYIRKGDMEAAVRRIVRKRLHPGDWKVMEAALAQAKVMRQKR